MRKTYDENEELAAMVALPILISWHSSSCGLLIVRQRIPAKVSVESDFFPCFMPFFFFISWFGGVSFLFIRNLLSLSLANFPVLSSLGALRSTKQAKKKTKVEKKALLAFVFSPLLFTLERN